MLDGDGDGCLGVERHPAGQQLVEDHADGVEVRGRADSEALSLLGREVLSRTQNGAGLGHVRGARSRDAEVGHLGVIGFIDNHVVRL